VGEAIYKLQKESEPITAEIFKFDRILLHAHIFFIYSLIDA